jgi:hypothetical protein
MYADAGYRTRTHRVTGQDVPTTPQRHTFTNRGIKTIYYKNRLVILNRIIKNKITQPRHPIQDNITIRTLKDQLVQKTSCIT